MPVRTLIIVLLAVAALAGCGRRGALEEPGADASRRSTPRRPTGTSPLDPGAAPVDPGAGSRSRPPRAPLLPRLPALGRPVHHFAHRGGVLHAEDVPVPKIAAEVGTPFYCYSTATLTRHYRVFDEAFAGLDHLICYSLKANSNQAVIATLGEARRRRRRRLGGRAAPRARRRHSAGEDRLLRRRQDGARARLRARRRHPLLQRRVGAGARAALASSPRAAASMAPVSIRINPGRRREDAREDLDRAQGEQVRRALRPRPRDLCARRDAAGHPRRRHRHAYRQPAHRACSPSTTPSG